MRIILPWPPKALNPNSRQHWSTLAKAKKEYRHACGWSAKDQGAAEIVAKKLTVSLEFFPPDRRARDTDNMLAAMKSGLDGLADVLGVDDRSWKLTISRSDQIGGFVAVTIGGCDAE